MTREEAINELSRPLFDPKKIEEDINYVLSKIGLSRNTFDEIINRPGKKHTDYKTDKFYPYISLSYKAPLYLVKYIKKILQKKPSKQVN